jgi:hypothetical protein
MRFREVLAPVLAAVLIIAVALGVLAEVRLANRRGTDALIAAKVSQVGVTASSFDARYAAQLGSSAGLSATGGGTGWELRPNSPRDQRILNTFDLALEPGTGVVLLDARGIITAGLHLDPNLVGTRFSPAAWNLVKAGLATRAATILPVTDRSVTSAEPTYSYVLAIPGTTAGSPRGAIVVEMPVTAHSALQTEIAHLDQPEATDPDHTDQWLLLDGNGTVVASSTGAGIAKPVDDPRYIRAPAGRMDVGSRVVVTADVPTLGWRLVFQQDRSELAKPLSAPLQYAGLALMMLVLIIGLILSVVPSAGVRPAGCGISTR